MDDRALGAAQHMAWDEALFLETQDSGSAFLRFYHWESPAVTIGYFDQFPEKESRNVVRRITGGGLVEHGEDATYCLTLPQKSPGAGLSGPERYRRIHEALCDTLCELGCLVKVERGRGTGFGPCFTNPVAWDLVDEAGKKVAGGAQRRSRGAVIHQGSVQLGSTFWGWEAVQKWAVLFAEKVGESIAPCRREDIEISPQRITRLVKEKYGDEGWNRGSQKG